MTDGNPTPESPKRTSRRDFLKIAGAGGGGTLLGVALGRLLGSQTKSSEVSLTPEQAEKQSALRELKNFMEEYTTDRTVSNFLASASPEDINNAFTLVQEDSLYYASPVNAWNLKIPTDSGETTISYRNKKMNPNEGQGYFQEVRVYLDKDGKITAPLLGEFPTQDEMKSTFNQFTSRPLVVDSDWRKDESITRGNQIVAGPRPIEGEKQIVAMMRDTGLALISISNVPSSPPLPPSAGSIV